MKPIPESVRSRLQYDPITGIMYKDGVAITYHTRQGYLETRIDYAKYKVHRLAWFLMTGEQPTIIDHINGVTDDNRWCNLRHAKNGENDLNRVSHRRGQNPGVYYNKQSKKWKVQLPKSTTGDRQRYIGAFSTLEEANEVACAAIKKDPV